MALKREFTSDVTLTPMLDLVLQLVFFFMVCAGFIQDEERPQGVMLPIAASAKPTEQPGADVQYLTLGRNGDLIVPGADKNDAPLKTAPEILYFLKVRAERIRRDNKANNDPNPDDIKTLVIIRADKDADFASVFQLMRLGKEAGFRKFQLRAMQKG